jgi:hypothetical protein
MLMENAAIFDMDVYKPTFDALQTILHKLTKGSILVFDQFNAEHFPGETKALDEVLGLNNIELQHFSQQANCS